VARPSLGIGDVNDSERPTDIDPDDVKHLLRDLLVSPSYRPPLLPQVASELMQLSQRANVQFEEVVKLLERDPVLAARTLSIAQSAFYATRSPVTSLNQAAVRLGLKTLRELVLEAALHLRVFRVPGMEKPMERLSRHSTATAHVVRAICRRTALDAEYAFLIGLLHDVGFAGCLLALAEDPYWKGITFEQFAPVLDELHEEASALLTRMWKLPDPIQQSVAHHHDVVVGGKPQPINAALILAEQLCWEAGLGMLPPPEDADPYAMAMPEPPLEGIDANWTGVVQEAAKALKMDELAVCAARAEAFDLLEKLGLTAPRKPKAPAAKGAPAAPPAARR